MTIIVITEVKLMNITIEKESDLAGPGIGNYDDLEKILPRDTPPCYPLKKHNARFLRPRIISRPTSAANSTS